MKPNRLQRFLTALMMAFTLLLGVIAVVGAVMVVIMSVVAGSAALWSFSPVLTCALLVLIVALFIYLEDNIQ